MTSYLTHLECALCGREYDANRLQTLCEEDGRPLYPRYDLKAAGATLSRGDLTCRLDGEQAWLGGQCVTVVEGTFYVSG